MSTPTRATRWAHRPRRSGSPRTRLDSRRSGHLGKRRDVHPRAEPCTDRRTGPHVSGQARPTGTHHRRAHTQRHRHPAADAAAGVVGHGSHCRCMSLRRGWTRKPSAGGPGGRRDAVPPPAPARQRRNRRHPGKPPQRNRTVRVRRHLCVALVTAAWRGSGCGSSAKYRNHPRRSATPLRA